RHLSWEQEQQRIGLLGGSSFVAGVFEDHAGGVARDEETVCDLCPPRVGREAQQLRRPGGGAQVLPSTEVGPGAVVHEAGVLVRGADAADLPLTLLVRYRAADPVVGSSGEDGPAALPQPGTVAG